METSTREKRNVNRVGDTGIQVAENVKRLRGGGTYKELSKDLANLGREITVLGLRRIESGERKVDVDDLMALAIVFGVSPLTLLLPPGGSVELTTKITGMNREISQNVAWLWARGDEPLRLESVPGSQTERAEIRAFELKAKPHIAPRTGVVVADTGEDTDSLMRQLLEKQGFVSSEER